eukprot:CAMPEP_0119364054 /NCGR_PEP_ID=MMETSP1334-20130426/10973_1 /TAXON_ID=127549 /ORGANISM="Calcidiscus leptoporus, Strain RCC1130" /LENGTH=548 /DNA_ID=CAMNT_0007379655 /DNA_START=41 /DNA_END=1688 /DNA_ORIENTATION=-
MRRAVMLLLPSAIPASLTRTVLRPITTALQSSSRSSLSTAAASRFFPTLQSRSAHVPLWTRNAGRARCSLCAAESGAAPDISGCDPADANRATAGFETLGIHALLLPGLGHLGVSSPTEIQSLAVPTIIAGGDTVILDETGSGKTLAYALPVLHAMLEERAELADSGPGCALPSQALFLVPNSELAVQVRDVLQCLIDPLPPAARLRASALTEPEANGDADLLVATPNAAYRSWRGSYKGGLRGASRVRWLVLDEADQLLAGSFKPAARAQYPVEKVVEALKSDAKRHAPTRISASSRDDERKAAAKIRSASTAEARQRARMELRRLRAGDWASKQFVLAAATMPNAGLRNIDGHVRRCWPSATWVRTGREHREKARVRQFFVRVEPAQRADALRAAVEHGPAGRTLVFANTLASAEAAYDELRETCDAGLFHKERPPDERRALLAAFQSGALPVLVSTGLAARGIDFQEVAHVVQYEMAQNVVEFIHRVGRTARAGRAGVATNLYDESGSELVEAIQAAIEQKLPIDHLFSRKRRSGGGSSGMAKLH